MCWFRPATPVSVCKLPLPFIPSRQNQEQLDRTLFEIDVFCMLCTQGLCKVGPLFSSDIFKKRKYSLCNCGGHVCIYKCLCILVHVFVGWGQPWVLFLSRHWQVGFRVLTGSWGSLIGLCNGDSWLLYFCHQFKTSFCCFDRNTYVKICGYLRTRYT